MSSAAYADFLRGLISNPRGVSAPTPSSPTLARAIAAQVDIARDGLVILTTNLSSHIDHAFLRRIAYPVHFPAPTVGQIATTCSAAKLTSADSPVTRLRMPARPRPSRTRPACRST